MGAVGPSNRERKTNMSTYLVAAFLLLFGIDNLFKPAIPSWVLGLLACGAGLVLVAEKGWPRKG
jgi:hypothetical protein